MAGRVYHLWRGDVVPMRWSCDLVEDPATEGGWRLDATDPVWCGPEIVDRIRHAMEQPVTVRSSRIDGTRILELAREAHPGDPDYVGAAVRSIQSLYLSAEGRP